MSAPARAAPAPTDPQIEALLGQMTVEEKAGQLTLYAATAVTDVAAVNPTVNEQSYRRQLSEIRAGRVGGLFNGRGVAWAKAVQGAALKSRLKIPLILGADVIHGFRTIFPVPLAEAASWEPALAERTARAAAIEATANSLPR